MLINEINIACYINGIGVISPQRTYNNEEFLTALTGYDSKFLTCILPNFKDYISPFQLRRLSRMLRVGLSTAIICLRDAGLETPDAIITATGYGFQEYMGKFLNEIMTQDEQQLTPTYFMQSTHNALSGLIALYVKCTGYNSTYAGKAFPFEAALHDALLLLQEEEAENVLVGSFDEVYPVQYNDYDRLGYLKKEKINSLQLLATETPGTVLGEGTVFFCVSGRAAPHSWCLLQNFHMIYRPVDYNHLSSALLDFLKASGMTPEDIDVLVSGISGDFKRDFWNRSLQKDFFDHATVVHFKHLIGDYATAASFGLWLGAKILKTQIIPDAVLSNSRPCSRPVKTVLVCNHFLGKNYSFFLLTKA
ncbi:MAG: beta-ketoacyl synthase chain length factor [Syntrophales bacterium]|jgi:3-oxoacyl-(acyl-carrier-protein) synthase|nr:beta-ketoacyl synthase chain length factor [Syntrophales bacterium]